MIAAVRQVVFGGGVAVALIGVAGLVVCALVWIGTVAGDPEGRRRRKADRLFARERATVTPLWSQRERAAMPSGDHRKGEAQGAMGRIAESLGLPLPMAGDIQYPHSQQLGMHALAQQWIDQKEAAALEQVRRDIGDRLPSGTVIALEGAPRGTVQNPSDPSPRPKP